MNKTISISLAKINFQLEENAYKRLSAYLDALKNSFASEEGVEEIMQDIEVRFAEIFSNKKTAAKEVIDLADVEEVIAMLGEPEHISAEQDTNDFEPVGGNAKKKRRFFRHPSDKVLGGVLSGLNYYLGLNDPIWLRLIVVIITIFFSGVPIVIYILLWAIVPEAKNASEILQMKGEDVNLGNIERTVRDGLQGLNNSFNNIERSGFSNFLNQCFVAIGKLIKGLAFVFSKVFAVAVIIIAVCLLIGFVFTIIGGGMVGFSDLSPAANLFFTNSLDKILAYAGGLLFVIVPAFWLLYAGFRLLLGNTVKIKGIGVGSIVVWILSVCLLSYSGMKLAAQFSNKVVLEENNEIVTNQQHLNIDINETPDEAKSGSIRTDFGNWQISHNGIWCENVKLELIPSSDSQFSLNVRKKSRGAKRETAEQFANGIEYKYWLSDSTLTLDEYFNLNEGTKLRDQEVFLELFIPEGATVYIDLALRSILRSYQHATHISKGRLLGNTWLMQNSELICQNCEEYSESSYDGSGHQIILNSFDALDVAGPFDIDIEISDKHEMIALVDDEVFEKLKIEQQDDIVSVDYEAEWLDFLETEDVELIVYTKNLNPDYALDYCNES